MTTSVSQAATAFDLGSVRTGQPVVSAGWQRWSDDLSFILGHNLHACGGASISPRPAGRTALLGLAFTVSVPYSRSPGAQVVRVSCELAPSDLDTVTQIVTTVLPVGAVWLDAGGLDGSVTFPNPPMGRDLGEEIVGWCDVSGVTVGALTTFFSLGVVAGDAKGAGIRRVNIVEVPLSVLDNVSTEPVLDGASVRPGRLVVDGGPASTAGAERLFYLLDSGRAFDRRHFCLSGVESADAGLGAVTPHWYRDAAGAGAITWLHTTGTSDVAHYLRARNLYASTVATTWQLVVRYRTSGAVASSVTLLADGGSISAAHLWVPAVAAVPQALALPATAGAWAWATMAVTIPGDGTLGLVRRRWEATTPLGGVVFFATLALIEAEP